MTFTESDWIFKISKFQFFSQFLYESWPLYKGVNYTESDWKMRFSASFCINHALYMREWIIQKVTEIFQNFSHFLYKTIPYLCCNHIAICDLWKYKNLSRWKKYAGKKTELKCKLLLPNRPVQDEKRKKLVKLLAVLRKQIGIKLVISYCAVDEISQFCKIANYNIWFFLFV